MLWLTGEYQPPRRRERVHYVRDALMDAKITMLEKELGMYGECSHPITVPVEVWTGECVARICRSCDAQLLP